MEEAEQQNDSEKTVTIQMLPGMLKNIVDAVKRLLGEPQAIARDPETSDTEDEIVVHGDVTCKPRLPRNVKTQQLDDIPNKTPPD